MGKARNSLNPASGANREQIRNNHQAAYHPRAAAVANNHFNNHHQQQRPPQNYHFNHHAAAGPSTLRNKKKFKGGGVNKRKNGGGNGGGGRRQQGGGGNPRKRHLLSADYMWGTPIPEKYRALSPILDENGEVMSKEEREVFYRKKVEAFDLKIPVVDNLDSLPTKNILAIVAGLTEVAQPSSSTVSPTHAAVPATNGCSVDIALSSTTTTTSYNLRKRPTPKLPAIVVEKDSLEGGEISDDEIICISDSIQKKNKKKANKRRSKAKAVRRPSAVAAIDVIELNSDKDEDDESVIWLDDENSEKEFANLSITTERIQKTATTSNITTRSQNGASIIESQSISSTTKTTVATQCIPVTHNMGFNRLVRHFRRSLNPISPITLHDHLDSLSYHIALYKHITLRGPEFVGLPPPQIDYSKVFRIVSYNVLCQSTMQRTQYLYKNADIHPEWFYWPNRWHLLSTELRMLTADIYCLQEVEEDKVADFYEPLMVQHKGWKSFYAFRDEYNGEKCADGCAIFWNPIKFEKIEEIVVRLNHGVPNLDRPNVAQILRLQHRKTGIELIVVNTHILFNPKRGDIKLYQLAVIFANLRKIRTKNQPIIFCGDFNLEPDSILYNFIVSGEIDCTKCPCYPSTMSGQKRTISHNNFPLNCISIPEKAGVSNSCSFICENESGCELHKLHHCFNFESVYGNATFDGDRIISTYHQDKGNPDFMFYSVKNKISVDANTQDITENNLFLYRRLSLPGANALERYCDPFPNKYTGSDHIPLCAEFFLP